MPKITMPSIEVNNLPEFLNDNLEKIKTKKSYKKIKKLKRSIEVD